MRIGEKVHLRPFVQEMEYEHKIKESGCLDVYRDLKVYLNKYKRI